MILLILVSCVDLDNQRSKDINVKDSYHPNYVVVGSKDSLISIAKQYHVSLVELMQINKLTNKSQLKEGQKINLPKNKYYIVQKNDSMASIAKKFDIDMGLIASLNHIKFPYKVSLGTKLKIPGNIVSRKELDTIAKIDNNTYDYVKIPAIKSKNNNPEPEKIISKKENLSAQTDIVKSSAKTISIFWPAKGKITSYFGPNKLGGSNDGITIELDKETQVKSMSSGMVVYSAIGPNGYGNLIIIKHENDLMSAYANLEDRIVVKGQSVDADQAIGKMAGGQLYFALRLGKNLINPLTYLPKK